MNKFARRAFGTELKNEDIQPYFHVARNHFRDTGNFVEAAKAGLKAVICSPRFLMIPGEHTNASYRRAAELAQILWLSVPDAPLLELAKSNTLSGDVLRQQIHRMLADKRSDRMVKSLCDQWLNLRMWNTISPSLKLYPRYDDLLHHFLPRETRAYLADMIRRNLPVRNLIDSDYSFLNQRLAQHYKIPNVTGQQLRKVSIPEDVPRGGLLTMGSILKVTTDGFDTSPILRGAWISKTIVGTPISPPLETVQAVEPQHGNSATTLRQQIEQHKSRDACRACHKSIDPYGFALENFDATGQWRTKYRLKKPHPGTFQFRLQGYFDEVGDVDAAGEIYDRTFSGIDEFKNILLNDERKIAYNFAKTFFEYATGAAPTLHQRLTLLNLLNRNRNEYRMQDLITEILVDSLDGNSE